MLYQSCRSQFTLLFIFFLLSSVHTEQDSVLHRRTDRTLYNKRKED
ncbi:hypothetical protein CI610_00013 [invertebrate metagenome]|uniref:Uncharacterized protein n=1 Tax=invertebrate metagenome TaxID=1711999 RepID=A0A2H9TCI4_9ZZZZ